MTTPKSDAAIDKFPEFMAEVLRRMNQAKPVYGDSSFGKDPAEVIGEVQQELMDVCAWSYIVWTTIEKTKAKIESVLARA